MVTVDVSTGRYWHRDDVDVAELAALVEQVVDLGSYPSASDVEGGVVLYDIGALADPLADDAGRARVMGELARVLAEGPGAIVLRGAVEAEVVDRATSTFEMIIEQERSDGGDSADHFAADGANDRMWNALEKLALADPSTFVDYYASEAIALASRAWLGPAYQVTSQVNVVRPGGVAQEPHRDYHLGFMTDAEATRFPAHVHAMSAQLTLQGAVAHRDMPVESGPTKLLPHSQRFPPGYVAYRRPEIVELFEERFVQLPLAKGDALFFNPALLHAAGTNRTTDVRRMANLLQVSSAFGRAMETVDRTAMSRAIYPELVRRRDAGWSATRLAAAVGAAAEGYAFPTNLDRDPPSDGLAPPSQADLVHRALSEGWSAADLDSALDDHAARRRS